MAGWVGLGMGEWVDGWMGGFVKVDNRFGYEKWLQGGSIGLALLRSKKKREKLRSLLLHRKKIFFYIYDVMMIDREKKKALLITT
jgi:hypothetical protein